MALPGSAFYILHFASDVSLAFDIFPTQRYLSVLKRVSINGPVDGDWVEHLMAACSLHHIIHFITSTITDTPRLIIRTGEILRLRAVEI